MQIKDGDKLETKIFIYCKMKQIEKARIQSELLQIANGTELGLNIKIRGPWAHFLSSC